MGDRIGKYSGGYTSPEQASRDQAANPPAQSAEQDPQQRLTELGNRVSATLNLLTIATDLDFNELDTDNPQSREPWERLLAEKGARTREMLLTLRNALVPYSGLLLLQDRDSDEYHSTRRQIKNINALIGPTE